MRRSRPSLRNSRLPLLIAIPATIFALVAISTGASASKATGNQPSKFTPEQLADVAHAILNAGSTAASSAGFGGVVMDADAGSVTTYVVGDPPPALVAVVQASPEASAVQYVQVSRSYAQLATAMQNLSTQIPSFRSSDIDITMVGVDPRTNSLVVGVLPRSVDGEAKIQAATSAPITFTTDVGYLEPFATRLADTAPYNAGDFFVTNAGAGTEGCTTGPIVKNPSTGYVYT